MKDRDNAAFAEPLVRQTIQIFALLAATSIDPIKPEELAEHTGIPVETVTVILISLCLDEYVRETAAGFQTIGQKVEKLNDISHKVLDESLVDGCTEMPRRRHPNGAWEDV